MSTRMSEERWADTPAVFRACLPRWRASPARLFADRPAMSDEGPTLCFFVGANSIFKDEIPLIAENPAAEKDGALFHRPGVRPTEHEAR